MTVMACLMSLLLVLWVGVTVSTVVDLQKRIYGGKNCEKDERLYHVSLSPGICGGSLITTEWILTAAHCKKDKMYAVVRVHPGKGPQEEIETITPHPTDDLMLLKLKKPITGIPVPLPDCKDENNNIIDEPKIDDEVQVAGYGRSEIDKQTLEKLKVYPTDLQCANMHVIDCEPTRNSPCYSDVPYGHRMCYMNQKSEVDTCPGDSGGGVIYNKKIYGVIKGSGKCACKRPAVAVKVCSYIDWIETEIKK